MIYEMSSNFGVAVYVSVFEKQKSMLEKLAKQNVPVFTSLHIGEEVSDTYVEDVQAMCDWLYHRGFSIMADVSPYTLERFEVDSLADLVDQLHLDNLRLDFGFDIQSLADELQDVTLTFNASTILGEMKTPHESFYMHNFYPRPETGLDKELFETLNKKIREKKGKLLAFISGDLEKRGPIYEGLPTLENHRYLVPYAQYIDLIQTYEMDAVYLGDINLSNKQLELILQFQKDGVVRLPVTFQEENKHLYNELFTVRVDSPNGLIRVQESREFAQSGKPITPNETMKRTRGSITMDNERYKRYSGEVQIMRKDYPADERVNVIGKIADEYLLLLNNLKNGQQFMFLPE